MVLLEECNYDRTRTQRAPPSAHPVRRSGQAGGGQCVSRRLSWLKLDSVKAALTRPARGVEPVETISTPTGHTLYTLARRFANANRRDSDNKVNMQKQKAVPVISE